MAKTVLVVDDDPTQRRLIQAVLEREGFAASAVVGRLKQGPAEVRVVPEGRAGPGTP